MKLKTILIILSIVLTSMGASWAIPVLETGMEIYTANDQCAEDREAGESRLDCLNRFFGTTARDLVSEEEAFGSLNSAQDKLRSNDEPTK
jgi:hypothetical protein